MSEAAPDPSQTEAAPRWQPLVAADRRVLGVLVEKAKTTPEGYPMSVNALRTGCNQKSNRYPLMELEVEDVEESLTRLRELGAVGEVHGGGRVPRYRHYLLEWLGVDKAELAVMAELLLRGAQTEGELRGRVARMEPLADLNALRPLLVSLKQKGLVLALSPEGRGHTVTHALYQEQELEKVRSRFVSGAEGQPPAAAAPVAASAPVATAAAPAAADETALDELREQLDAVREEVARLREELTELRTALGA
ncbi:MAG: DUF480 domain-containing protein [Planctomycetota bacterium]|nr:MAG: DUF480 domain-containing protein [Planctomycetota bacterium]